MLAEFERVVVVDWSCPDESGDYAISQGASAVYKYGEKLWNASKARNLGARNVLSEFVCFIDADSMVMPGLRGDIERILRLGNIALAGRRADGSDEPNLCGFLACSLDDFWTVGGYEESFEGYAIEDIHLRAKLALRLNKQASRVDGMSIGAIQHSNELRAKFMSGPIEETAQTNYLKLLNYLSEFAVSDYKTDPRTESIAYHER